MSDARYTDVANLAPGTNDDLAFRRHEPPQPVSSAQNP